MIPSTVHVVCSDFNTNVKASADDGYSATIHTKDFRREATRRRRNSEKQESSKQKFNNGENKGKKKRPKRQLLGAADRSDAVVKEELKLTPEDAIVEEALFQTDSTVEEDEEIEETEPDAAEASKPMPEKPALDASKSKPHTSKPKPEKAKPELASKVGSKVEPIAGPEIASGVPQGGKCRSFGATLTGKIFLPRSGHYSFWTCSSDGSKLWMDGEVIVDNDGVHSMKCVRSGKGKIYDAGLHTIKTMYFESSDPASQLECMKSQMAKGFKMLWEGPGIPKAVIPVENLQAAPVDCEVAAWNGWSKCSKACGGGLRVRERKVLQPAAFGGKCPFLKEHAICNAHPCSCKQACESTPGCHAFSSKKPSPADPVPRCKLMRDARGISNFNRMVSMVPDSAYKTPGDSTFTCRYHPGWYTATISGYKAGSCDIDIATKLRETCLQKRDCDISGKDIEAAKIKLENDPTCHEAIKPISQAMLGVQVTCQEKATNFDGAVLATVEGKLTSVKDTVHITGHLTVNGTETDGDGDEHPGLVTQVGTNAESNIGFSRMLALSRGQSSIGFKISGSTGYGRIKGGYMQIGVLPSAKQNRLATQRSAPVGRQLPEFVKTVRTHRELLGCYTLYGKDMAREKVMRPKVGHMNADNTITIHSEQDQAGWSMDACAHHCSDEGFTYCAIHNPNVCSCGNSMAHSTKLPDSTCKNRCEDGSQCGALGDTFGQTIASIYGSGLKASNPMNAYRGCFKVDAWAWFEPDVMLDEDGAETVGGCMSSCARDEMPYAALGDKGKCLCSGEISGVEADEKKCNLVCAGSESEICGGKEADVMSVYSTGAKSDSRVGTLDQETKVETTSVMLVQANGIIEGGNHAGQYFHLQTALSSTKEPFKIGGHYSMGNFQKQSFSLLEMYPVQPGHHRVSLRGSVGGTDSVHNFNMQEGKKCIGEYTSYDSYSPGECAVKCRADKDCQAFSSNFFDVKECLLSKDFKQCDESKKGWVTYVKQSHSTNCLMVPEHKTLELKCEKGKVFSEIASAEFGYFVPSARLKMSAPDIDGLGAAFLKTNAKNAKFYKGSFTGKAKLEIAAISDGNVVDILSLENKPIENPGASFSHTEMGINEEFTKMVYESTVKPMKGKFSADNKYDGYVLLNATQAELGIPVVRSTGKEFEYTRTASTEAHEFLITSLSAHSAVGDVNGDGMDDIILVGKPYESVGCYYEKAGAERAIAIKGGRMQTPNPSTCMIGCAKMGHDVFGLQGDKCYCLGKDSSYDRYGEANYCEPCKGFESRTCGSRTTVSVYSAEAAKSVEMGISDGAGGFTFTKHDFTEHFARRFRDAAMGLNGMVIKTGDYNADGLIDIASFGPDGHKNGMPHVVMDVAYGNGDKTFETFSKSLNDPDISRIVKDHHELVLRTLAGVPNKQGQVFKANADTSIEELHNAVPHLKLLDGDFNGDGSRDIVIVAATNERAPLPLILSHGGGEWSSHVIDAADKGLPEFAEYSLTTEVVVTDLNADYNDDLIIFSGEDYQTVAMSYGDGRWKLEAMKDVTAFELDTMNGDPLSDGWNNQILLGGDFNDDLKNDLIALRPGKSYVPVFTSKCKGEAEISKPAQVTCRGNKAMPVVHDACIGNPSCKIKASRELLGDGCDERKAIRKFNVQAICSTPGMNPKPFKIGKSTIHSTILPDATLYTVLPPLTYAEEAQQSLKAKMNAAYDEFKAVKDAVIGDENPLACVTDPDGEDCASVVAAAKSELGDIQSPADVTSKIMNAKKKAEKAKDFIKNKAKMVKNAFKSAKGWFKNARSGVKRGLDKGPGAMINEVAGNEGYIRKLFSNFETGGDIAVPSVEFETLKGYNIEVHTHGQALLVMTAHGRAESTCTGVAEFHFFVNGEKVQSKGFGGHRVPHQPRTTQPVVFKMMRMVQEGKHQVELKVKYSGCPVDVGGMVFQVAKVPIAKGLSQFALYHENPLDQLGVPQPFGEQLGGGQLRMTLTDGKQHIIPNIPLPKGVWFHYAAVYDRMMIKVYVDGKVVKEHAAPDAAVINADRAQFLRIGEDNEQRHGMRVQMDNLRVWNKMLSAPEVGANMYTGVKDDSHGLLASWDMSEGLIMLDTDKLISDDVSARVAEIQHPATGPNGTVVPQNVTLKNNIMTGPFVWEICPGAKNEPIAAICSSKGRCNIHSRSSARCDCFPNYFGDDCGVSCPNAGLPGGACHVDYGWGKCTYDKLSNTAKCKCIKGVSGDACQYPCPGKGRDDYGKYLKRTCAGRGKCHMPEEVKIPLTMADARNLTMRILSEGIGKYKGEYDMKRLLGVSPPANWKALLSEESACAGLIDTPFYGNASSDYVSCRDQIAMSDGSGFPPQSEHEYETMAKTLARVDHTAECKCQPGLFGFACQVLCPKSNGATCRNRGPSPWKVGAAMRVDQWFGSQISHLGEFVNEHRGCMWGMFDAGGMLATRWKDGKKTVSYRDPFVNFKAMSWTKRRQYSIHTYHHLTRRNLLSVDTSSATTSPSAVTTVTKTTLRKSRIRRKLLNKATTRKLHSKASSRKLLGGSRKSSGRRRFRAVFSWGRRRGRRRFIPVRRRRRRRAPLLNGVVADCRCWKEVGYHGNEYACLIAPPGANWESSGSDVCGGSYKFSGAEATAGVAAAWGLKQQERAGLGPTMSWWGNSGVKAQMDTAGLNPRGMPFKAPVMYPNQYRLNAQLNKCNVDGDVLWTGDSKMHTDCTVNMGSEGNVAGSFVYGEGGKTCTDTRGLYTDTLTKWHGQGFKAYYYDRHQPTSGLEGMEIVDNKWRLKVSKHAFSADYSVGGFKFKRYRGSCQVKQYGVRKSSLNFYGKPLIVNAYAVRNQLSNLYHNPYHAIPARTSSGEAVALDPFSVVQEAQCLGFVHTWSWSCSWHGWHIQTVSCQTRIPSGWTGYCRCRDPNKWWSVVETYHVGCGHGEFTCADACKSSSVKKQLLVSAYKDQMCGRLHMSWNPEGAYGHWNCPLNHFSGYHIWHGHWDFGHYWWSQHWTSMLSYVPVDHTKTKTGVDDEGAAVFSDSTYKHESREIEKMVGTNCAAEPAVLDGFDYEAAELAAATSSAVEVETADVAPVELDVKAANLCKTHPDAKSKLVKLKLLLDQQKSGLHQLRVSFLNMWNVHSDQKATSVESLHDVIDKAVVPQEALLLQSMKVGRQLLVQEGTKESQDQIMNLKATLAAYAKKLADKDRKLKETTKAIAKSKILLKQKEEAITALKKKTVPSDDQLEELDADDKELDADNKELDADNKELDADDKETRKLADEWNNVGDSEFVKSESTVAKAQKSEEKQPSHSNMLSVGTVQTTEMDLHSKDEAEIKKLKKQLQLEHDKEKKEHDKNIRYKEKLTKEHDEIKELKQARLQSQAKQHLVAIRKMSADVKDTAHGITMAKHNVFRAVQACKKVHLVPKEAIETKKSEDKKKLPSLASVTPAATTPSPPAKTAVPPMLQEDGSIKLKHSACRPGHVCTFEVKQTMGAGTQAQTGGRPGASAQSNDVEQSYIVKVENLGVSETGALMKLDVVSNCDVTNRASNPKERKKRVFDSSVTGEQTKLITKHPVYFMQFEYGGCASFCYHPEDEAGIRQAKKHIMKEFCTEITGNDAITKKDGPTSVKAGELYQVTHVKGVEAPYRRKYKVVHAKDNSGGFMVHFDDDHLHSDLLEIDTPLGVGNMMAFRTLMSHGKGGVFSRGTILLDPQGHVVGRHSTRDLQAGQDADVSSPYGSEQTEVFGNEFKAQPGCAAPAYSTEELADMPHSQGTHSDPSIGVAGSTIKRGLVDGKTRDAADGGVDKETPEEEVDSAELPKNLNLNGNTHSKVHKIGDEEASESDIPPRCAALDYYPKSEDTTQASSTELVARENWSSEPIDQTQIMIGLGQKEIEDGIEAHLHHLAIASKDDKPKLTRELLKIVLSDEYSVKHMAKLARAKHELTDTAMWTLGAASTGGHLKSVCHSAQKELQELINSERCKGECAYSAITHLGLVKHKKDLHESTLSFLLQHAKDQRSPHWEPATMMLGSLARNTQDESFVAHAHEQIAGLDDQFAAKKLTPKRHLWMRRTLLHTLGNAGHPAGMKVLAKHMDHEEYFIQHAAIKAMGNVRSHVSDLALLAIGMAKGDRPDRAAAIRREACQALNDRKHPMGKACHDSIAEGSRELRGDEAEALLQEAVAHPTERKSQSAMSLAQAQITGDMTHDELMEKAQAILGPFMLTMGLPGSMNMNMSHTGDFQWDGKLGDGKKISGEIQVAGAYEMSAAMSEEGLYCVIASASNPANIFTCLDEHASLRLYVSATGNARVKAFGYDTEILRASLAAAGSLFPLPNINGEGPWQDAFKPNYRAQLEVSILMITLPIWRSGWLADTRMPDMEAGGDTESSSDNSNSDSTDVAVESQTQEGNETSAETMFMEDVVPETGLTQFDLNPNAVFADDADDLTPPCDESNAATNKMWGQQFTLFTVSIPIGGPVPLGVNIQVNANLEARAFAAAFMCGQQLMLEAKAKAGATMIADGTLNAGVNIGYSVAGVGIAINVQIGLAVANGGGTGTAGIGGAVLNPSAISGYARAALNIPMSPAGEISLGVTVGPLNLNMILLRIKGYEFLFDVLMLSIRPLSVNGFEMDFSGSMSGSKRENQESEEALNKILAENAESDDESSLIQTTTQLNTKKPGNGLFDKIGYGFKKLFEKDGPVERKGYPNYADCKKDEDCVSNICVKMGFAFSQKICRPAEGFAKGKKCYRGALGNVNDCNIETKNFCFAKPNAIGIIDKDGICADQAVEYSGCVTSGGCRSGVCTLTNNQALGAALAGCAFAHGTVKIPRFSGNEFPRCQCRPHEGFKVGTPARFAEDCATQDNSHVIDNGEMDEELLQRYADHRKKMDDLLEQQMLQISAEERTRMNEKVGFDVALLKKVVNEAAGNFPKSCIFWEKPKKWGLISESFDLGQCLTSGIPDVCKISWKIDKGKWGCGDVTAPSALKAGCFQFPYVKFDAQGCFNHWKEVAKKLLGLARRHCAKPPEANLLEAP
jgi:hypothetical protein